MWPDSGSTSHDYRDGSFRLVTADSSDRRGPLISKAELVKFEPVLVSHEANKPDQIPATANKSRPV